MREIHIKRLDKVIRGASVLIVILLILNYITTMYNMSSISKQVDMISSHPFPVTRTAGEVNVFAARLRAQAERLEYSHAPERVDLVERTYQEIDEKMVEVLSLIEKQYITDVTQPERLSAAYENLRQEQGRLISLCRSGEVTNEKIKALIRESIFPGIEQMETFIAEILRGASNKFSEFEARANRVYVTSLTWATILTAVVLSTLVLYQKILNQSKRQEESMRQNLRDALLMAQNANAAKSQFLSNMSHDIRTPLNAIVGMTAIAGMHIKDESRVKDCLEKITVASRHLLGLINDVLDMSKIESGKIVLDKEEFSLPEFIQDFLVMVSPQAKARQLDLDIVVGNVQQEMVLGDTMRLNQILLNIVGNSVKFTEPGGKIRIKISEEASGDEKYGRYRLVIEDTGAGMSREFLEKIFLPFEREKTSTISRTEGTGLGMAITKNLVDMMNGEITVESERGRGTRFTLILPLEWKETDSGNIQIEALQNLRAMVVDDDLDVCENTVQILEEIGMEGKWVETGEEAVDEAVCAHRSGADFHTIIMDWKLPGMDGVEATRRIRKEVGAGTPIILLTAYDWSAFEEEARLAGVTAFLSKPLFKSRLYQVMREVSEEKPQAEKDVRPVRDSARMEGRVLLAEDNSINMEIAAELLKQVGVDSEQAWDGEQAVGMVRSAAEGYYQMILMDIQMPNLDGYGASREIRRFEKEQGRRQVPIVAMTANAFSEDMKRAFDAGMNGYITKPIDIDEVNRVLRRYLLQV